MNELKPQVNPQEVWKLDFFIEGKLNPLWVSEYAEFFSVKVLAEKGMRINQLRAFFNEFLRVQDMMQSNDENWVILARLIEAKAIYRTNSSSTKLPNEFAEFVSKLVFDIGNDQKKFRDACLVFEALVAYFKKENNRR